MKVFVLNKHGNPLMPCNPKKARLLLKQQKAVVAKQMPFTIRLLYGSSGYKQPVSLGVDAGSKHIGIAATTEKEVLFAEELTPRNDVVNLHHCDQTRTADSSDYGSSCRDCRV